MSEVREGNGYVPQYEHTTMVRVFTHRAILKVEDSFYWVHAYNPKRKLIKLEGYVRGDYVYIYKGKLEKRDPLAEDPNIGGIYKGPNGEHIFFEHKGHYREDYHVSQVTELDPDRLLREVAENEDSFVDHNDIEVINNNTAVWKPSIEEDDDFLKYTVKQIIIQKGANLKNYKDDLPNQYLLNNLKNALNKKTKMSVPNFKIWCEILGVRWTMIIEDDGKDPITPLRDAIQIESEQFL